MECEAAVAPNLLISSCDSSGIRRVFEYVDIGPVFRVTPVTIRQRIAPRRRRALRSRKPGKFPSPAIVRTSRTTPNALQGQRLEFGANRLTR